MVALKRVLSRRDAPRSVIRLRSHEVSGSGCGEEIHAGRQAEVGCSIWAGCPQGAEQVPAHPGPIPGREGSTQDPWGPPELLRTRRVLREGF